MTFIFISSIILISLFFPSVFFAKYKNDTTSNQLESIKQKNAYNGEDPVLFIKKVNGLVGALSDDADAKLSYSEIIKKIISLKNKDIKILSFIIEKSNPVGKKIIINGIANTRDSLTLFNKNITADGSFESVVFPVSDFIKSSDSQFSATLII